MKTSKNSSRSRAKKLGGVAAGVLLFPALIGLAMGWSAVRVADRRSGAETQRVTSPLSRRPTRLSLQPSHIQIFRRFSASSGQAPAGLAAPSGATASTSAPAKVGATANTGVAPAAPGAMQDKSGAADSGQQVDYARDVAPILRASCAPCHGADAQQSGLRLDSFSGALKGGLSGNIIIPGDGKASLLVRRLTGQDQPRMPFKSDPLAAAQIDLIRTWIDQGAKGADAPATASEAKSARHWAYIKPVAPEIPKVKNAAWVRNPIDSFVLVRLEKEGLSPSPEADKETLLRRVSLDLAGLPPTPEELDAFLADDSPKAYEKVVDRLLASPHYGERWARPWLDLARYADTNGYEADFRRVAWKYRDWVINALNRDMSFREFTIEQIAGDMLPKATVEQKIATGFHRNTMLNQEGGVDPEEFRWYALVDRVNTTASVWLGSTLGCAQCHNHKFDPFTQKDYYRMLAFYDNVDYKIKGKDEPWAEEPQIELPTAEQDAKSRELNADITKLKNTLSTSTPELEAAQLKWEAEIKGAEANWSVLRPAKLTSAGGATLTLLGDQSILAGGKNPYADTYLLEAQTPVTGITAVRLEVMGDPSLPHGGPGRDADGNFFLTAVEVEATPAGKPQSPEKIKFKEAVGNESQDGYNVKNLVSADISEKGWAIESWRASSLIRQAVLTPEKPFGFVGGTALTVRLKHELPRASRNVGRFRLSVTNIADPAAITRLPAWLRPALDLPEAQRSNVQKQELAAVYRSVSPLLKAQRDRRDDLQKQFDKLGIATALVMEERPGFERPATFVRNRGSYLSKADKVYADVPGVLPRLSESEMPNRLGLAYWLVDDDNPLTARVTVNRYWEQFFGHGIVETAEDFGTQGARPTNPELLDWLATEFMRQGWSMKAIKRAIVTSATYRQASRATPEALERDPYNRLLGRGPRFRVEAEMVRDIALAASGLLSPKMGGPSVFPYQTEGLWDRPYNADRWVMSEGEDRYRRGVYTFMRRTVPYPSMVNFDAPSREFCTVRRVRTNTPLQALTTLNDPAFFEAAQALAKKMISEAGPDAAKRATYGFRRCLSRRPGPEELNQLLAYHDQQLQRFRNDPKAAESVTSSAKKQIDLANATSPAGDGTKGTINAPAAAGGAAQGGSPQASSTKAFGAVAESTKDAAKQTISATSANSASAGGADTKTTHEVKSASAADTAELAAWTMVANVMLNLDETVTKE